MSKEIKDVLFLRKNDAKFSMHRVAVVRNFITVLVRKKGSQKWKLLKETGELMSTSGIIIGFGIISISEPVGRGANGCAVAMEMMV